MVSMALRKQMARAQVPDEDILSQLVWLQEMVHAVIIGPAVIVGPQNGPEEQPETDDARLSENDMRILELLGRGEDLIPPLTAIQVASPVELDQAEEITD
jgi:hypothetical protein